MSRRGLAARASILAVVALVLAGCSALLQSPPVPAPEPFPGVSGHLGRFGVDVLQWTSGDAGCANDDLKPTAIRFTADGLDQATPVTLRIYIFRDKATWEARQPDVATCASAWATDPATFQIVQVSPYIVAGQGPWPPMFAKAISDGLSEAAGSGG